MSTLLLTFANNEGEKALKTLKDEFQGVSAHLSQRIKKRDFVVVSDPIADRKKITDDIRRFKKDMAIFLFSGHAGDDHLIFSDGKSSGDGIADLLGDCRKLKLVILNGCSTFGHVKSLLEKGIPIVIATSSAVGDPKATLFSIAFFRELSEGKKTIREAFKQAMKEANGHGAYQESEIENRGFLLERNPNEPLWGLYFNQPIGERLLDVWKLPTNEKIPGQDNIGKYLRNALSDIGRDNNITNDPNTVLGRLPFIINDPIRQLFSKPSPNQVTIKFYNTPTWDRFQMLLYAYRAVINLTTYILLAELWEERLEGENQLSEQISKIISFLQDITPNLDGSKKYILQNILNDLLLKLKVKDIHKSNLTDDCRKLIQLAYFASENNESQLSNLTLLQILGQTFKGRITPCLKLEVGLLFDKLEVDVTKKALDELELKIKTQDTIERNLSSQEDTLELCLETEKSFSRVLRAFGFMVNFSLTSVKEIQLKKYRNLNSTSFIHRVVPLRIKETIESEKDDELSIDSPLDNSSILIHPNGRLEPGYILNLSPFLIDKNALIKAQKDNIHYLMGFSPSNGLFRFGRVESYEDVWPISPEISQTDEDDEEIDEEEDKIGNKDSHALLITQIDSFAEKVLNKKLGEL